MYRGRGTLRSRSRCVKATVRRVVLGLSQGRLALAEWLTSARRLGGVWPSVAGV